VIGDMNGWFEVIAGVTLLAVALGALLREVCYR
jgi:hypothetical protein